MVGLCIAYELARLGSPVLLLDAGLPGQGASLGNAGWVTPALAGPVPAPGVVTQGLRWMLRPDSPLYIKPRLSLEHWRFMARMTLHCRADPYARGLRANAALLANALELFDEYKSDGITCEEHRCGMLMVFDDSRHLAKQHHGFTFGREGLDTAQRMSPEEAAAFEPALRTPGAGAIFFEQERTVRPDQFTAALVERVRVMGVDIRSMTEVTGFTTTGDKVHGVRTRNGELAVGTVVLAGGAHTPRLTRSLGRRLPVQPGRGYSVDCPPTQVSLSRMIYLYDQRIAITPFRDRIRVSGGMEFAGFNRRIGRKRVDAMLRATHRALRGWPSDCTAPEVWAGDRPVTPDGLPVIGRLQPWTNAYVATGHAMLGLTAGPSTARALVNRMLTGRTPAVLRPFNAQRFGR